MRFSRRDSCKCRNHVHSIPVAAMCLLQTMSLEEYEAQLAAKKAELNKPVTEVKIDLDGFKGMKT